MRQIKEKAPATPASVTSATHKNQVHIEDTIKNLIRQVEPVNFNLEDLFIYLVSAIIGIFRPPPGIKSKKKVRKFIGCKDWNPDIY